ncbi:MAG: hypothetical protein H0W86_11390 [Armatimonadetes bacterium]|nr:hypothetical protein [Armatimonadota bacterium]
MHLSRHQRALQSQVGQDLGVRPIAVLRLESLSEARKDAGAQRIANLSQPASMLSESSAAASLITSARVEFLHRGWSNWNVSMPCTSWIRSPSVILAALLTSNASGQSAPPAAALENVTSCVIEGTDVFIGTGKGTDARRYKYQWDASVDALCNAKGFAITAPTKSSNPPVASSPAASPTPLVAPPSSQASDGLGFPTDSRRLEAGELTQLISGRVVKTFTLDGSSAGTRVQYERSGLVYLNTGGGAISGRWRVEGSTVCYTWSRGQVPDGCVEVRLVGDRAYARRATGEIVRLEIDK